MRLRRLPLLLALAVLLTPALAQSLSVNGRTVEGFTLSLVPGVSYAPAADFANALGARLFIDYGAGLVSLELGGRVLALPLLDDPNATGGVTMRLNGEAREGRGALISEGQLYLPVSAVAQAFLGYTTYVQEQERVMVVTPRGSLRSVELVRQGSSDRLVISMGANVPFETSFNEPLNALEIRFDRSDAGELQGVGQGRHFSRVGLLDEGSSVGLRIVLEEESDYQLFTVDQGRGYQLVVDLFERDEEAVLVDRPVVVIDPGHGGEDTGAHFAGEGESSINLQLSREVARLLERAGVDVRLTRPEDQPVSLGDRSALGVGADLFVSLHTHPSSDGSVAVYYLEDAAGVTELDLAIRTNARSELQGRDLSAGDETAALRRRILLNLIPDLEVGRRYAQGVQSELFNRAGVRVADPVGAPLAVLAGAAGRGLLLEVPAHVAQDASFGEALAQTLVSLLQSRQTAFR